MKKLLLLLVAVVSVTVFLNSCKPDEEIYNPKCKISKIWYRSEVGDPSEVYVYDKHDRQIQKILIGENQSFDFTYNKDKSISKITHVGADYTEEITFTNTKRLVDKMVYTVDGVVRMEMLVSHDEDTKRISKIEETYDVEFFSQFYWKKSKHELYDKIVGNYDKISEIVASSKAKDLTLYSVKNFTYDPGKHKNYDNIAIYVEEFPIAQTVITHTIQYDLDSYNPFYGLTFAYADYNGYYLNNKVSEHIETVIAGTLSGVEDITYSYEGFNYMNNKNFPRQFITTSSVDNVPVHTYILYK